MTTRSSPSSQVVCKKQRTPAHQGADPTPGQAGSQSQTIRHRYDHSHETVRQAWSQSQTGVITVTRQSDRSDYSHETVTDRHDHSHESVTDRRDHSPETVTDKLVDRLTHHSRLCFHRVSFIYARADCWCDSIYGDQPFFPTITRSLSIKKWLISASEVEV